MFVNIKRSFAMKGLYFAGTAAILTLAGLGIYSSQAQNAAADNSGTGVLIIEEDDYAVRPSRPAVAATGDAAAVRASETQPNFNGNVSDRVRAAGKNAEDTLQKAKDNAAEKVNQFKNNATGANSAQFEQLPGDPGVEVAPDNQPVASRAMKNQNPNYNNGIVFEEDVIETAD